MDTQSRKTASIYINNLLLSRGLLRNGKSIEFATPEQAEGGVDATMTHVMNLVHDLVLRRDRESDTLSSLSHNLQTLRTSSAQHTQTITRLETKNADLDRQVALTAAQERTARATLRAAETRNRAIREEVARLKGCVSQIRAQCATDIRRRDGEIQRLKRHLEGRRGRDGASGQIGVVVVTPNLHKGPQGNRKEDMITDLESPTYSLTQETTEFLTQLSKSLSDENDALIGLVKGTLATLRSLQGLPDSGQGSELDTSVDGFENLNNTMGGPPSFETLATNTDEVLEHLRSLLTNPSFVPLEEVEVREEEIHRLRDGWEKMASRWKEAMTLLDGWKKRMVDTGDTINLDDLRMGIELGTKLPMAQEAHERSLLKPDEVLDVNESDILQDSQIPTEDAPSPEADQEGGIDLETHEADRALCTRNTNSSRPLSARKVSFQPIGEENGEASMLKDDLCLLDFSTLKNPKVDSPKMKSRIPLQKQTRPTSPVRSVQERLDDVQAEAEAARKREHSKPKRKSISKQMVTKKLKGSRRRSTLSPEELENLMGIS